MRVVRDTRRLGGRMRVITGDDPVFFEWKCCRGEARLEQSGLQLLR
jgi:hypothetical protein